MRRLTAATRNAGYQFFEGAMYKYHDTLATQADAQAVCRSAGAHLVSIHSKRENAFVFELNPDSTASRWIGLVRDRAAGSMSFEWIDGSGPLSAPYYPALENEGCQAGGDCASSTNGCCIWKKNEPNDRNPNFTPENCVSQAHIKGTNNPAGWDDSDCSETKYFVCKRPGTSSSDSPIPFLPRRPSRCGSAGG